MLEMKEAVPVVCGIKTISDIRVHLNVTPINFPATCPPQHLTHSVPPCHCWGLALRRPYRANVPASAVSLGSFSCVCVSASLSGSQYATNGAFPGSYLLRSLFFHFGLNVPHSPDPPLTQLFLLSASHRLTLSCVFALLGFCFLSYHQACQLLQKRDHFRFVPCYISNIWTQAHSWYSENSFLTKEWVNQNCVFFHTVFFQ